MEHLGSIYPPKKRQANHRGKSRFSFWFGIPDPKKCVDCHPGVFFITVWWVNPMSCLFFEWTVGNGILL